ncbi:MAG TPA: biotin/lipoyl-containing protein, partial [Azospira sp.]|nr:biotin/lipoyl-containing protein [Azospira sp.]
AALARMRQALADYRVVGVTTNIDFLSRLVACPAFAGADLDTDLIERQQEFLFAAAAEPPRDVFLAAAVAGLLREQEDAAAQGQRSGDPWSPWHARDGWRMNLPGRRTLTYRVGDALVDVGVAYRPEVGQMSGQTSWQLTWRNESVLARGRSLSHGRLAVELDDRRLVTSVIAVGEKRHVFLHGATYVIERHDPLHLVEAGGAQGGGLTAPMPGKVIALLVQPGQAVDKGAPLLILEAMKMEHTITAPKNGILQAFRYGVGEQVADGAELVDFAAA